MTKILFITNLAAKIDIFSLASISAAHDLGINFYHASNWQNAKAGQIQADEAKYNIKIINVPISRSPFAKVNRKAYKEIVDLIKRENIDYIHCNTPTGGILGRLAGKKCKVKKVIYQAHGFHFYKGAPKKNWLLYYPVEKWLARHTDALITINQEDYKLAKKKFKLRKGGNVYYVPGVGIDVSRYNDVSRCNTKESSRKKKRMELNIPLDAFVLISMGELNVNKNNRVIISALERLKYNNIHYIVCGVGDLETELRKQVDEAGLSNNVHFLGYRNDVKELYETADCFVMPSFREGLSRSIMEAMASGLPCIVSKIRGNVDLVDESQGGFLCAPKDDYAFSLAISALSEDITLRNQMSDYNQEKIKNFDVSVVEKLLKDLYAEVLGEE